MMVKYLQKSQAGTWLSYISATQEVSNQTQEKNAAQRNKFSEEKPLYKPASGSSRGR